MEHAKPKLGPFELLRRLGAGGMAETFLAVRRGPAGFEQRVCIKRILPAYESDREFVDAFLDEARTSAALRHANIVQVVDFGLNAADGSHYLALELVDGMDLRALIERQAEFDAELVTLIASELAAALQHAHAADEGRAPVVHRDLSPSNVLISRAGEIKLTDFGIARAIGGSHRTASGVIKGKIPYMPPEYVEGGRFDARGDLFALGVLIYELLHGRRPFDGDSELDTLRRIAAGERRPFEASAPAALVTCVDRLLQRDPAARFEDAHALLDALPSVPVHQVRRRLAALVRARTSQTSLLDTFAVQQTVHQPVPRTLPLAEERPPQPDPRTPTPARATPEVSRRRSSLLPSRAALLALVGSLAISLCVLALAVARGGQPQASVAPRPPRLPAWPGMSSINTIPGADPSMKAASTRPQVQDGLSTRDPLAEAASGAADVDTRSLVRGSGAHSTDTSAGGPDRRAGSDRAATSDELRSSKRELAELYVVVYPFGDVWVDDKPAGPAPLSLHLAPGSHEIAVGEGRARERQTVRLRSGESRHLTFRSSPAP
jgi:serine/threonine protein kinase